MAIKVTVPMLPESVADATILTWHKQVGEFVNRDESLVDLETDKVVLEIPVPESGILKEVKQVEGKTVEANDVLAIIEPGVALTEEKKGKPQPIHSQQQATTVVNEQAAPVAVGDQKVTELSPSVRRLISEHQLDANQITATGKGGRLTKNDVESFIAQQSAAPTVKEPSVVHEVIGDRLEKRVPMSRLRARVAQRLLQAQHNAALLTTFNEVNLQAVMDLRTSYKEQFEKRHKVRLGFMSFFTKAAVEALKRFPAVNASIDGQDIIYHGYYDIGIAVSTERGLVVPVIRDADKIGMADIEHSIVDFAARAKSAKLSIEEMQGGTFTITNGGVFGSLLATPIINPPQTAILGMHKIEKRPIVEHDQIVIRPMMYLALSYDHRLIDGKESVQFLVTIKELLEDPSRLLLDV